MARYIDADKFKEILNSDHVVHKMKGEKFNFEQGYLSGLIETQIKLADMSTADVEPVRHGHIVKKKRVLGGIKHFKCPKAENCPYNIGEFVKDTRVTIDELFCSECGKVLAHNYLNYCPNCGAKMEEG